MLKTVWKAK